MAKNKTIKAWAVSLNGKIYDCVHGEKDEQVVTFLTMPTKEEAEKCIKLHAEESEVVKVEIKILPPKKK